jgi:AP2 domain
LPQNPRFMLCSDTRRIPLSKGLFALVDECDFDWLRQWKWSAVGTVKYGFYAIRGVGGRKNRRYEYMHRVILSADDSTIVDHRNGNKLDNRRRNLRLGNQSHNGGNAVKHALRKRRTSRFKGVCWDKSRSRWHARITVNRRGRFLGRFLDEAEAASCYDQAAREVFGKFACLNFPRPGERGAL